MRQVEVLICGDVGYDYLPLRGETLMMEPPYCHLMSEL